MKLQTSEVGVIKGSSGLLGAIVLATTAYFAALTPAAAVPVVYVLSPPVTDSADTITVTGSFTLMSGPTLDAVDLVATGGPQPGTYTVPLSATASEIVAEIPSTTEMIRIGFAANLGDGAVAASFVTFPPAAVDPLPVSGAAVPATIPEPGSLALLGSALAFFLGVPSARRCSHQG